VKPSTAAVLGIGLRDVKEWYELGDVLGSGNFGVTRLAHSKLSRRLRLQERPQNRAQGTAGTRLCSALCAP